MLPELFKQRMEKMLDAEELEFERGWHITTDLTGILNGTPGTLDEITKKSIETANNKSAKEALFKQKPIK